MTAALLAKTAAEKKKLEEEVVELRAKVAASEKRAAAETELVAIMKDPRAPLDLKPVDVEDFLAKRTDLEALPDVATMRTAVKIASKGSFDVGTSDTGAPTDSFQSTRSSKADRDFENHFLGQEGSRH